MGAHIRCFYIFICCIFIIIPNIVHASNADSQPKLFLRPSPINIPNDTYDELRQFHDYRKHSGIDQFTDSKKFKSRSLLTPTSKSRNHSHSDHNLEEEARVITTSPGDSSPEHQVDLLFMQEFAPVYTIDIEERLSQKTKALKKQRMLLTGCATALACATTYTPAVIDFVLQQSDRRNHDNKSLVIYTMLSLLPALAIFIGSWYGMYTIDQEQQEAMQIYKREIEEVHQKRDVAIKAKLQTHGFILREE